MFRRLDRYVSGRWTRRRATRAAWEGDQATFGRDDPSGHHGRSRRCVEGLQALFGAELNLAVVADCTTGEQTIEAVRKHRPDVLVLDLWMRGFDGLAVLRTVNEQSICPRTVLLTAEIDDEQTLVAVRLGATAVVLKEMAPHLLVECIRKVHAGERWVERQSVGRALEALLRRETGCGTSARFSPTESSTSSG